MFTSRFAIKAIIGTPLALLASATFAHPKLVSSAPADQAKVTVSTKAELKFSETLMIQFSGANLVITEMPDMPGYNPVKVGTKVSIGDGVKVMVIASAQSLTIGTYKVEWRTVSLDTYSMTGNFTFKVK